MSKEVLGFQTEVKQILHLMIHSLYSNKEIFLRELISNASDACDKLRFEALNNDNLYEQDADLGIRIAFDKDARTLTISDNGIGMTRDEVIQNIGTIARSGTKAFLENLSGDAKADANLIGQFGVGFYSSFIVADKVTLITRKAGTQEGVKWESEGSGEFSIEETDKPTRGTDIILHLKADEDEFLDHWRLSNIIRKYSDHITLPVYMKKMPTYDEEGNVVTTEEEEAVNQAAALWARPKSEISEEQYKEFYKHVSHDYEVPLAWSHAKVEGRQEYTELLYIPKRAPFDLYERDRKQGIKLYVRRVFIMEDTEKLLPQYLRFVRGIIDSANLPLNVSREILQHGKDIDTIKAGCVKKVLDLLNDLAQNKPDDYATFWQAFGTVFKEGLAEDSNNKEKIAKLCRFASTHLDTAEQSVTLEDYVARMKTGQEAIYYVTADIFAAAKNSPHLEVFRKKGIEVLLLSDRIDEWVVSSLTEFDGKKLVSVAKGDLDLGAMEDEAEKEAQKRDEESFKDLTEKIKETLGENVKEVRVTHRLTDSPACLVADKDAMSAHLERLLKSVGQGGGLGSKPILEINPHHSLINKLNLEPNSERFNDLAHIIYEQALLAEGAQLPDPASFVKRINHLFDELI
jgi:molecular chaperone HtpG